MPLWISALLQALRDLIQPFLAYMLGKEQLRRKQAEENLELQESYEKLDEQNKSYRDRGKSVLLERLRQISGECRQVIARLFLTILRKNGKESRGQSLNCLSKADLFQCCRIIWIYSIS